MVIRNEQGDDQEQEGERARLTADISNEPVLMALALASDAVSVDNWWRKLSTI